MTEPLKLLDVRPILRDGGEPFAEIMQAVASLADGQGLRLLATFKPEPLFAVLGRQGFSHSEREIEEGEWEITFTPEPGTKAPTRDALPDKPPAHKGGHAGAQPDAPGEADARNWPAAARKLDNRGLMPPEPMVLTLEAIESMADGEVLEIINDRDPKFLYPELAERGHLAHRAASEDGGIHVLIRKGAAQGGAA